MILKEPDATTSASPTEQAGEQAERQMGFYLARLLGPKVADVFVLNDLRLSAEGVSGIESDAVQVDHLVLHPHGLIVIESKSVTTRVSVNSHGEWQRWWNGGWKGMPSPVSQARRQGEAIRAMMQADREVLRERKILGLVQGGFRHCPIDVLVAFSDRAVVETERGATRPPEVFKADLAAEESLRIVERHRGGGSLLGTLRKSTKDESGDYRLTRDEMERVGRYLLRKHVPRAATGVPQSATPVRKPAAAAVVSPASTTPRLVVCRHCGSAAVRGGESHWGNRAYYTVCGQCGKGTDLDTTCAGCRGRARIRKEGVTYWRECAAAECGRREVLFVAQAKPG